MKILLLPLLVLSLPVVAQYRPIYSPSRPIYSPSRPSYSSPSSLYHPTTNPNVNYRAQQQQQQQAHQNFQRMQAQQRQQMQDYYYYHNQRQNLVQQQQLLHHPLGTQQLAQVQARQQEAEQKANEKLARLTEAQRQHLANPPADAQQAAAQQREDARQLTELTLENYRQVFLPGQLVTALQSLTLTPKARQDMESLNHDLLDKAWWAQQDATQLSTKIAAHSATLTTLSTDLLGFNPAAMPAAPAARSVKALQEQLSQGAAFDQSAAAQLIQEAARAEKLLAGARLAQAVTKFSVAANNMAASSATTSQGQKKQRNEAKKSFQQVNKELQRYTARVGSNGPLLQTQAAIMQATAGYLAKNQK